MVEYNKCLLLRYFNSSLFVIAYHRKDAIKNLGVSWNSGDHVATLYGEEILSLNVLHYGFKVS